MNEDCLTTMDNKAHSQYVAAMLKQLTFLKTNGFPGTGIYNDCREFLKYDSSISWDDVNDSGLLENHIQNENLIVKIPFAGTNFSIQLYFNIYEPWLPPDIIFSDNKFMKYVIEKEDLEDCIPCLDSWNYLSEDIICQLLHQLHQLYKKYQLQCLEAEEVLHFEYSSLTETINVSEEDIEISLSGGNGWLASLLIRLPLNLKDVPPVLLDLNPGRPTCLLHVAIKKNSGVFTPRLFLSPQVESLIGNANSMGLPVVPPGSSLSEYIIRILELLDTRVKSAILSFETRKQLVAQFLCCMGTSLVEYDAEKFKKISFFLDWNDFHFLLIVEFPEEFPKCFISVTLRSVYHLSNDAPFTMTFDDVRLPGALSCEDMVEAIKTAVHERLPGFKKESVAAGK